MTGSAPPRTRLRMVSATIGYGSHTIVPELTVDIPHQSFTAIIGPNGSGKSTVLRAMARLLPSRSGSVTLDDREVLSYPAKEFARALGLLPQTSTVPDGMLVADLVGRGRYAHQRSWRQWTPADSVAVNAAMASAGVSDLSRRRVDELSGGQRQRVWIAMVLAQNTEILLLDEPTTFLDIAHQMELLELFRRLHHEGRTLVAVLHDLNDAARYATHIIAMKEGRVVAEGEPSVIVTQKLVEDVFGIRCVVVPDPVTGGPHVIPVAASTLK